MSRLSEISYKAREWCAQEFTCGEDHVPGDQLIVHYGKLRELDARHPRHGRVSSFPVELDVVGGVTVCKQGHGKRGDESDP